MTAEKRTARNTMSCFIEPSLSMRRQKASDVRHLPGIRDRSEIVPPSARTGPGAGRNDGVMAGQHAHGSASPIETQESRARREYGVAVFPEAERLHTSL